MFNPFSTKAEQHVIFNGCARGELDTPEVRKAEKRIWIKSGIQIGLAAAAGIVLNLWVKSLDKKSPNYED